MLCLADEDLVALYLEYLTLEVREEVIYYNFTKSHMEPYFVTATSLNVYSSALICLQASRESCATSKMFMSFVQF